MKEDQQTDILLTGKIVSDASRVESLLGECGAAGDGMREKIDSLGDAIPDELRENCFTILKLRNRAAHEAQCKISRSELALFDAAIAAAMPALENLAANRQNDRPATPEPAKSAAAPDEPAPRRHSILWMIPGLHIVYGLKLLLVSLLPGTWFLFLTLADLMSLVLLFYSWSEREPALAGMGGGLLAIVYGLGLYSGRYGRYKDEYGYFFYLPVMNLFWFAKCFLFKLDWTAALASFAILGGCAVAGYFLLLAPPEPAASAVVFLISWSVAVSDSRLRGERR